MLYNKADFVSRLAKKGYTKKDAESITDDFVDAVTEILAEGDSVQFYGFGTFSVRESAEYETIDYQTKERISIPKHYAPRFAPGQALKRAVREHLVRK